MSKRKITSKRSKTTRGEYDVFRNGKKIGEIFRSVSEAGSWAGILTDEKLSEKAGGSYGGSSVGSRTKRGVLAWFFEWFS
jgi:hypothetical protein